MNVKALETVAWAPYDTIAEPTREDWRRSYEALKELAARHPEDGRYPNTLGYLCFYGRHTGQRNYEEARQWFEKGADLCVIESTYKLADMLMKGLGGESDPRRAYRYYDFLYDFCRDQFESGMEDGKFADVALRMGRLYHEGIAVEKDDLNALGYLLEAKLALNRRKSFKDYGDDTVEKNILTLIDECEKPCEECLKAAAYGMGLGRVMNRFLNADHLLTFTVMESQDGDFRLEFRRKHIRGKKPNKVLWSIPPAMKCFLTDFVVIYAENVRELWRAKPEEPVTCDGYSYEPQTDTFLFTLNERVVCRLAGGEFTLPMQEFFMTGARNAVNGSEGKKLQ